MEIIQVDIDRLIPYARNARTHSDAQVAQIAASIREFGFNNPILLRDDNTVIAGHGRLLAARKLGITSVPVVYLSHLTETQARAYVLADNQLATHAGWDSDLLQIELDELAAAGVDAELLGFSDKDLREILPAVDRSELDAEPQIDKAAELAEKWGVKTGQLWELGEHRLLCGDSTKKEDVEKALGGASPLLMVTDPPYGVNYDADWRNDAAQAGCAKFGRGAPGAKAIGKVENDDRADWREAYALFSGDVAYVWHAALIGGVVEAGLSASGFSVRAEIIWNKSMHIISRGHYHWKHEPCWYAVRQGKTASWIGDRSQMTVWDIARARSNETGHSTEKPVECMARPIRNHDSEYVYEPFSGSGTTIIACEQLGRKCRAIEISPGYVAVALQRWADATGKTPELVNG